MGVRNYLVEGVSGTGKTSVCHELRRRGHHAVNGDTELAYQGDPATGAPTDTASHDHHLWDLDRVRMLVADQRHPVTFLCGGSRNSGDVVPLVDAVFVLTVDRATLEQRLAGRPADEFGGTPEQRDLVLRLHATGEDVPPGTPVDATAPLTAVVDTLLRRAGVSGPG